MFPNENLKSIITYSNKIYNNASTALIEASRFGHLEIVKEIEKYKISLVNEINNLPFPNVDKLIAQYL